LAADEGEAEDMLFPGRCTTVPVHPIVFEVKLISCASIDLSEDDVPEFCGKSEER